MGSHFSVGNESMNEMIYEMNHILNCGYEIKSSTLLSQNGVNRYVCASASQLRYSVK